MLVDDNPANVRFMRDLVGTLEDVALVAVPTADLGIELARARNPALVILDIDVPGVHAFEAMRVLREGPETTRIPVIALSAFASPHDRRRAKAVGFLHFLAKPVLVDELVSALESVLQRG